MAKGGVHHSAPARSAPAPHAAATKATLVHKAAPAHAPTVSTSHASVTKAAPRPTATAAAPRSAPSSGTISGILSQGATALGGGMAMLPSGAVVPAQHARAMGYMGRKRTKKFSVNAKDIKSLTKIAKLVHMVSKIDHKHRHVVLTRRRHRA